jgi:polyisoprenyl-phosphate glycosyltransferase
MHKPLISVVIPVFNSAGIIPVLVSRIQKSLSGFDHEIVLVDDGSQDESWPVMKKLAEGGENLTAIALRMNAGQDNALLAGLRHASGEYIVIMDDDLQHNPEDIRLLYEKCSGGFDVVYAHFTRKKQGVVKKAGSRFNGMAAGMLVKKPKGIYLSPFKIIRAEVAEDVAAFAGPYPYIDGILLSLTRNVDYIEVEHHLRYEGKSNYSFRRSASVWFRLFTGFSVLPLRAAAIGGLLIALTGLALIGYYLYEHIVLQQVVAGWTTLVVLSLFFGGTTIMLIGLLGEYLGRIYLTLNRKPQYSIREKSVSKKAN